MPRFRIAAVLLIPLVSWPAWGQDSVEDSPESPRGNAIAAAPAATLVPPERAEKMELEPGGMRPFNAYAGVDFVSTYLSRGLLYSDKFSVQPWLEVDFSLSGPHDEGFIDEISWFAGTWNSFHDSEKEVGQARTGNPAVLEDWYESDVYTGLRLKFAGHYQVSLRFNWYTSPADSFERIQELDFRVSYDDSTFWERHGLAGFTTTPSLRIAKETRDSGGPEQWYFSPSLTPSFPLTGDPTGARIKFPLVFGFGEDGQYTTVDGGERFFGFAQAGIGVDVPLGDGNWTFSASAHAVILADSDLASCNAPDPEPEEAAAAGDETTTGDAMAAMEAMEPLEPAFCQDQTEFVARVGITYSF